MQDRTSKLEVQHVQGLGCQPEAQPLPTIPSESQLLDAHISLLLFDLNPLFAGHTFLRVQSGFPAPAQSRQRRDQGTVTYRLPFTCLKCTV